MILPIYAYGQPVLKKLAENINADYEGLEELIENMWETMYHAKGIGLAAPQIGHSIRMFVVDTIQMQEEGEEMKGLKQVFINAQKVDEGGDLWDYEEGCLSIPEIRGDVERPAQIRLRYMDEHFKAQETTFTGLNARVIQHEYDHIDGKLFIELLRPIKRRMVRRRLENIRKGEIKTEYKMKFARK